MSTDQADTDTTGIDQSGEEAALGALQRLTASGKPVRKRGRAGQAGAHNSDPLGLGDVVEDFIEVRGWTHQVSAAGVKTRWREIVGDTVAEHCSVENLVDGVLVLRASSTAWATQLRLLSPQLMAKIANTVGEGVVSDIVVQGPGCSTWKKGRLSVPGRGPRDTYG